MIVKRDKLKQWAEGLQDLKLMLTDKLIEIQELQKEIEGYLKGSGTSG